MSSTSSNFEGLDGIQSGIASKKIIDALVATRQKRVETLAKKEVDLETRVGLYSKIQGLVNDLKEVANNLSMASAFGHLASVSSAPDVIEGIVTGKMANSDQRVDVQPGTYKIDVDQIAAASRNYSNTFRSATQKGLLADSALTLQVGSKAAVTLTVDSGTSLLDVANQINQAHLGAHASVARGADNAYMLVVSGTKTGAQNAVQITEKPFATSEEGASGALLNLGGHVASRAQDTIIRVDGQDTVYRSANETVDGAIPGVSIKVGRGATEQKSMELRFEINAESVKAQLDQYVAAYNRLMRTIYEASKKPPAPPDPRNPTSLENQEDPDDQYIFNPDGTQTLTDKKNVNSDRYKLSGDKTMARLAEELGRMMNEPVKGIKSGPRAPSHVGVVGARDDSKRLRKDGTISIDEDKLRQMVLSDYDGIVSVFTADPSRGTHGVFGEIKKVLEAFAFNPATGSGPLSGGVENMRYEIRRVRTEMESRQENVDSYRKVLSAQFVQLEKFMAKHKAQGDYLNAVASAVSKR